MPLNFGGATRLTRPTVQTTPSYFSKRRETCDLVAVFRWASFLQQTFVPSRGRLSPPRQSTYWPPPHGGAKARERICLAASSILFQHSSGSSQLSSPLSQRSGPISTLSFQGQGRRGILARGGWVGEERDLLGDTVGLFEQGCRVSGLPPPPWPPHPGAHHVCSALIRSRLTALRQLV